VEILERRVEKQKGMICFKTKDETREEEKQRPKRENEGKQGRVNENR